MSERNYYVLCDDNCRFEGMTKEQVIAAIAEATGTTPTAVDDAFITKIKEQNHDTQLKFWIGTQAEYNALTSTDPNVLYMFTDGTEISDFEQLARTTATEVCGTVQQQVNTMRSDVNAIIAKKNLQGVILWSASVGIGVGANIKNPYPYDVVKVYVDDYCVLCSVRKNSAGTAFIISGIGSYYFNEPGLDVFQGFINVYIEGTAQSSQSETATVTKVFVQGLGFEVGQQSTVTEIIMDAKTLIGII